MGGTFGDGIVVRGGVDGKAGLEDAVLYPADEELLIGRRPGEAADVGDGSYYVLWPETTADLVHEYYNPYREEVSPWDIYSPFYNS